MSDRTDPDGAWMYRVVIGHDRRAPIRNTFRYRTFLWLWDLDRPPRFGVPWRWLAGFETADHLPVRRLLAERGIRPARVVVLAQARVLGYVFNPISVYWCYDRTGNLLARVAEVHNTYGGRHAYVLPAGQSDDGRPHEVSKAMYVSPFNPRHGRYRLSIADPGPTVSVRVDLLRPGQPPLRAWMTGRRHAAGMPALVANLLRYRLGPWRVRALIQWQGIRLWRRGLEVQPR